MRQRIDPIDKLKICTFVAVNSPTTREVQDYTYKIMGRRLQQSTISTILRVNSMQIQQAGGRGRRVTRSIEVNPQDQTMSTIANIPISLLSMLSPERSRNRVSKNVALEVRMLEEIYHIISSGQHTITIPSLQSSIIYLCKNGDFKLPAKVPKFLRDLSEKYFLAQKVFMFLRAEVTYTEMIGSLKVVYPSLQFATTNPEQPSSVQDTNVSVDPLALCDNTDPIALQVQDVFEYEVAQQNLPELDKFFSGQDVELCQDAWSADLFTSFDFVPQNYFSDLDAFSGQTPLCWNDFDPNMDMDIFPSEDGSC